MRNILCSLIVTLLLTPTLFSQEQLPLHSSPSIRDLEDNTATSAQDLGSTDIPPLIKLKEIPLVRTLGASTNDISALEYEVVQATFLKAKSAVLYTQESSVLIRAEELADTKSKGIVLTIDNASNPTIEITRLLEFQGIIVGVYPPTYQAPNEQNEYIILGSSGDRFGARVETVEGLQYIYLTITGGEPPPPISEGPTEEDLQKISATITLAVRTLNDPVTAAEIKNNLLSLPEAPTVEEFKAAIEKGLIDSLPNVNPPYKDWMGGFRKPIDKLIQDLVEANRFSLGPVVQAIIKGMQ